MQAFAELLADPAYRHVLLNHVPVTGLLVAWIVLVVGVAIRQRPTAVTGLALVAATAGSALIVMPAGEAAYTEVYYVLDGPGKERLDFHADLAGSWGLALHVSAALAFGAIVIARWRPQLFTAAASGVIVVTLGSLVAAAVVADAGGKIRHPEFRFGAHALAGGPVAGGPVAMRRLNPTQYRTAITDVFGADVEIVGRFEPDTRRSGLLAVGAAQMTITPSGLEQYEAMATAIAAQVVADDRRAERLPCQPADATAADEGCMTTIIGHVGERLFRRVLPVDEVAARVALATAAADEAGAFYVGVELALTSLLVAPDFLFRIERVEPDLEVPDHGRLTGESLAARLSYLLWDAAPDDELRAAAARGALDDPAELTAQVDRLLASPRAEQGMRAFFADLLRFDEVEEMSKDLGRYPIYNHGVARDAIEQSLRVIVDHLLTRDGDYRELFTTRRSFVTRSLGPLYGVPVRTPEGWEPIEFPSGHARSGLLSHASLNMLRAHPGRSSPTLRGQFLRESILCQVVPPAPADVEFALFNDDQNPDHKTARDRLAVHSSTTSCRTCHQLTDPIGLGLERFDGIGKFRRTENGAPIDASGDLDGDRFADSAELGEAFRDHPRLGPCLVDNLYRYAVGRDPVDSEGALIRGLRDGFAGLGYRVPALLREIALSEGLRTAPLPGGAGSVVQVEASMKRTRGGSS